MLHGTATNNCKGRTKNDFQNALLVFSGDFSRRGRRMVARSFDGPDGNERHKLGSLDEKYGNDARSNGCIESSGNNDADFANLMLPHHQAAIDMAKTELLYGNDPQIRRLAQEIITDQESEIQLMQLWLNRHGVHTNGQLQGSSSQRDK